jgi:hypothetical protein
VVVRTGALAVAALLAGDVAGAFAGALAADFAGALAADFAGFGGVGRALDPEAV